MGNVNLESFRIYEALDCGAIPVVEKRPWLDYFTLLFGAHPLPSVSCWAEAPVLLRNLLSDAGRLNQKQAEIRSWWADLQEKLSRKIETILKCARSQRPCVSSARALPGRLRGAFEMLKHHNGVALRSRALLTFRRLIRRNRNHLLKT
jgi:hypothetical protein